jgi:Flp pilus assembly protein TadG
MPLKRGRSLVDLGRFGRLLLRLLKNCDGNDAIEFAFIAIPLFLFLLGVIEFGRVYWVQTELQYATEATARYVAMNPSASTGTIQTYAATQVYGVSVPTTAFTPTRYNSSTNTPACGNKVTVSYQLDLLVASQLLPYGPFTLNATACYNG